MSDPTREPGLDAATIERCIARVNGLTSLPAAIYDMVIPLVVQELEALRPSAVSGMPDKCLNCDEAGTYESADGNVGPFCGECWKFLEDEFKGLSDTAPVAASAPNEDSYTSDPQGNSHLTLCLEPVDARTGGVRATPAPVSPERPKDRLEWAARLLRLYSQGFTVDPQHAAACAEKLEAAYVADSAPVSPERPHSPDPALKVCNEHAPDRSGRRCDKPQGHDGDHWTYGGDEKAWTAVSPERGWTAEQFHDAESTDGCADIIERIGLCGLSEDWLTRNLRQHAKLQRAYADLLAAAPAKEKP